MENATEKFRDGRPNFREDIKLFIGLPKQPLLGLSTPVKSEKLSPCSRGNLRIQTLALVQRKVLFLETPKTGTVLILLQEINDFLQHRQ